MLASKPLIRRALILGPNGSGKSYWAVKLAAKTKLPLYPMDKLFWKAGWVEPKRPQFIKKLEKVAAKPKWIIEGNYSYCLDQRLRRADTVVLLDLPRWLTHFQTLWRIVTNLGRVRPDMAPGCPERIDLGFLKWAWTHYEPHTQGMKAKLASLPKTKQVLIFKSRRAVGQWIEGLRG